MSFSRAVRIRLCCPGPVTGVDEPRLLLFGTGVAVPLFSAAAAAFFASFASLASFFLDFSSDSSLGGVLSHRKAPSLTWRANFASLSISYVFSICSARKTSRIRLKAFFASV